MPEQTATEPTTAERIAALDARHRQVVETAEDRARQKQHQKGKLTARERLDLLFDSGSFVELDEFVRHRCTEYGMSGDRPDGDGVITGYGTVDGRQVCAFSQDFTILGGSMGEACGGKVMKLMDLAMKIGCPVVGINDSGGARIQEGVLSLAHYAEIGRRNVLASGVIPQISLIMGPCAGGAVYSPAMTDVTVMVRDTSYMFVTGPEVVAAVMGERTTRDELGGAETNSEVAGNVHHVADDEPAAIAWVRDLLGYLPSNNLDEPPVFAHAGAPEVTDRDRHLDGIMPDSANRTYDMVELIERVVDEDSLLPFQESFAPNIICALASVEGRSVGVVANQPGHLAGAIDLDASVKAARFVRMCDAFRIPILTLVDVPGYLPGVQQERMGIIRHGAKLLYAYSEATVPLVTVVVGKAYGGGYAVMGSKHLGADINLAWPTAKIAVMGAGGAVLMLYRKALATAEGADRERLLAKYTEEYRQLFDSPYIAAERGYVDRVIRPSQTRLEVARALRALRHKRAELPAKRHGNIPL
ncbi:acyl-CoA carboxylase subunit beta [Micromonospora sp. WMMC241]|uniref:acyl-CoA carboxylase subunit beta n=1 Tax=Micromonospora sp. WMMC241 TaxID=3015159 RepID=UPI0022B71464|nr:acyl-CoA carboxylase subunit beta [Micromonospora sp. WMMC241]MCZ7438217.1 acyl-CoA carboxylase subunit beta [Micromonospora sp. WMMC241]